MKNRETADVLRTEGILSEGYGINPKRVMRDKRLTVEAKAIYAYISSFAGAGMQAFPGRDLMIAELGVSKSRYYKHLQCLIDCDYIRIERTKDEGTIYGRNIYVIVGSPDPKVLQTAGEDAGSVQNFTPREKTRTVFKKQAPSYTEVAQSAALRDQLGIEELKQQMPESEGLIEDVFLAVEDMATSKEIKIAGAVKERNAILDILVKLNVDNVRAVLYVLQKGRQIHNLKAYIQTCLVNSVFNMSKLDFSTIDEKNEQAEKEREILKAVEDRERERAQLYKEYPEFKAMDEEIRVLHVEISKAKIQQKGEEEIWALKSKLRSKNKERAEFVKKIGLENCI